MTATREARRRAERLIAATGARPTRQRIEVLSELMREEDDVTAQQLYTRLRKRGGRVGLATVYRTLGLLEGEGVIDALSHGPGELCYRWCGDEHHHHLVCSRCHRVVELGDCELEPWLDRLSAEHGFVATNHRLEVAGLCAGCYGVTGSEPGRARAARTAKARSPHMSGSSKNAL